jgi:hypothetical protein
MILLKKIQQIIQRESSVTMTFWIIIFLIEIILRLLRN